MHALTQTYKDSKADHFMGLPIRGLALVGAFLILGQNRGFADWQIVTSNNVVANRLASTHLAIQKLSTNALREDLSSGISMVFFFTNQEQFLLNHA